MPSVCCSILILLMLQRRSSRRFCGTAKLAPGAGARDLVTLVFNGEIGVSAEAHCGNAVIVLGQPEIIDVHISRFDFRVLDPERRVLCRLSLNLYNRELFRTHPDLALEEVLVLCSWFDGKDVARPARPLFITDHRELVVLLIDSDTLLILCLEGFLFALQELLEYPVYQHFGAILRYDF